MSLSLRSRFIAKATVGYVVFASLWIAFSDHMAALVSSTALIRFATTNGLMFVALTAVMLFLTLRAVPPDADPATPPLDESDWSWLRLAAALAPPIVAFALQWTFWEHLQPYAWLLFYPAVYFSAWISGVVGGVAATFLSTLMVWYVFIPQQFSFKLETPFSIIPIGVFFAMGVLFSLTHRRLRQTERNAAEAKLRPLIDQSLAGVYILQENNFLYVNRAFVEMFGCVSAADAIQNLSLETLIAQERRIETMNQIRRCLDTPMSEFRGQFPARRLDGVLFFIDVHGRSFFYNGRPAMIGIVLDVSERENSERARQESEQRLQLALTASQMGVWEWSVESGKVYWSPECRRICGITDFNATLDDLIALLHPEDADHVMTEARRAVETQKTFVAEFRVRRPDGEIRWISNRADPIDGGDGKAARLIGVISDITERKHAENELQRQAKEMLRQTEELRLRNEELERFNRASVGREMNMVELKRQVNELSQQLGQDPPYCLRFLNHIIGK
ncbi:membrane hypothetical protein [Azospirillaceae bacterium]